MTVKLGPEDIQADHEALLNNQKRLDHLLDERCFSREWIEELQIGWMQKGEYGWYAFPVCDRKNNCLFKKGKRPPDAPESQPRGLVYPSGRKACLYPLNHFDPQNETIVLCAGEPDTVVARSIGLPAICGTGGEKTFPPEWVKLLKVGPENKKLYILYDNDPTGEKGAMNVVNQFAAECPQWEFFLIGWPEDFPEKGDVTNFVREYKGENVAEDLLALTEPYTPPTKQDLLLEELNQSRLEPLLPIQDFKDEVMFYTISLQRHSHAENFVVTSDRQLFPCHEIDDDGKLRATFQFTELGYTPKRFLPLDFEERWPQESLLDYVKENKSPESLQTIHEILLETLHQHIHFRRDADYYYTSLWIIGTYYYRFFTAYPYIHLVGLADSGKTTVLQFIALTAFNGQLFQEASSPASIVRLIHSTGCTACIDEAENMWKKGDDFSDTLQQTLRSGYKFGIPTTKCEPDGDSYKVVQFDPYSPKALAGIQKLERALSTRCIRIPMQLSKDKKAKINVQDAKWKTIRSQIYPAVLSNFSVIREAAQSIDVPELIGREDEIWTPMLTMACAIDKETLLPFVIDLAQQSHKQRQREKESDEHGTVLRVVHGIMNEEDKCFVPAKEIFEELGNDEDFEWLTSSQWRYKRNKWLNNLLNHMGLWEGAAIGRNHALGKVKGYDILRKDVLSAADRYGVDLEAL